MEGCIKYWRWSPTPLKDRLRGKNELGEILVDFRVGLDVRCEDLSVLPEISQESVATPTAHDLHGLYRDALKQVEEGGTDSNAVALKRV